ncbi:MAG: hypothetical protein P4M11_08700 [Candidatus Pacebacteria bacterium]|nr:hypothetical protein [Candidatus Paceibacterota bacterium]
MFHFFKKKRRFFYAFLLFIAYRYGPRLRARCILLRGGNMK